jgi:hypothetical protein
MFPSVHDPNARSFDVFKREPCGRVHRIGVIRATNQVQADHKAIAMFGSRVWTKEQERAVA